MKKPINPIQAFRLLIQLFFLALVSIAAYRHQILGGGPKGAAPIDAFCPFGALETLYRYLATGEFIQRTNYSNFILLGGAILLVIIVGRYFCGWICAIGTLQELARKFGQKFFRKVEITIPSKIDKPLRYLKYIILIWSIWATWKTGVMVIRAHDPFAAYGHLFGANLTELWDEFAIGLSILFVSVFGSVFIDRLFCKYLCPLGAFLGLFNKISLFRIKRDESACLNCKLCSRKCPVNIPVDTIKKVDSAECIGCLSCVTICPTGKKGTAKEGSTFLHSTIAGKAVSSGAVALIGIAIYGGVIGITQITGTWRSVASSAVSISTNGQLDPAGIKGYMSLKDISETFKVDIQALYAELNLTTDQVPPDTKAKEIRGLLGVSEDEFDTQKIRNAVAKLTGFTPPVTDSGEKGHAGDK